MDNKDSLLLYSSYYDKLSSCSLTQAQKGNLLDALLLANASKEYPKLDVLTNAVFVFIFGDIERNNARYDETCKKRSEAGKASAEARKAIALEKKPKSLESNLRGNKGVSDSEVPANAKVATTANPSKSQAIINAQANHQKTKDALNWDNCNAALTYQQKDKFKQCRSNFNPKKSNKVFNQSSLNRLIIQINKSLQSGLTIEQIITGWQENGWNTWTHAYYANISANMQAAEATTHNKIAKKINPITFNAQDNINNSIKFIDGKIKDAQSKINYDFEEKEPEIITTDMLQSWMLKAVKDYNFSVNEKSYFLTELNNHIRANYSDISNLLNGFQEVQTLSIGVI